MAKLLHKNLTTTELHVPGYIASTDPGAVGAGILWIDTSLGTGHWTTNIRNSANTAWELLSVDLTGYATESWVASLGYIPSTRTVNGYALSSNIAITASDLGLGVIDSPAFVSLNVSTLYLGTDPNTDGTWKITVSGTDLRFERREAGSYVVKGSIQA